MSVTLYFGSNTDTMLATKALRDVGVVARMIPTPAEIRAQANLCLSIDDEHRIEALSAIQRARVAIGGVA